MKANEIPMDDILEASMLRDMMDQSQAAAMAVLVANIRKHVEESRQVWLDDQKAQEQYDIAEVILRAIENCALRSLNENDGKVVHWIGVAAKQMNPLLS